jgi:hypothetical protein
MGISLSLIVSLAWLSGQTKAVQAAPKIDQSVTLNVARENGLLHPAISVDPTQLQDTRQQLATGAQPWTAYYEAMAASDYASTTFTAANLKAGTTDTPKDTTFTSNKQEPNLSQDGFRAYTQAVMYYLTGQPVYRANALRLLRIWENMDPNGYKYYADAHIHAPIPFYYMVSAAELVKYTTLNEAAKQYSTLDLNWTATDNQKLTTNLINPVMKQFLNANDHYFNQHLYDVTGNMAGAIFKNDSAAYDKYVEETFVNRNTDKPYINGALSHLYYDVAADDPRNPTQQAYSQHLEMGRDQNHAKDDVLCLTGLARIVNQQGTKLDPSAGTVSTAADAKTPYSFLDDRLLKGSNQFYAYNFGSSVPWTQFAQQGNAQYPAWDGNGTDKIIDFGGAISQDGRGRMNKFLSTSELYNFYRYQEGYSKAQLTKLAPGIVAQAMHLTGPYFENGQALMNFWGSYSDNKVTEIGNEYWLSIPAAAKNDPDAAKVPSQKPTNSNVAFTQGQILDAKKVVATPDYLTVTAAPSQGDILETQYNQQYPKDNKTIRVGSQIALASLAKDLTKTTYQAIQVRSNGPATILVSSSNTPNTAYKQLAVPDTKGQWLNLVYSTAKAKGTTESAYIDFYSVLGNAKTKVDFKDFAYVNQPGGIQTTVPTFADPNDDDIYLVKDNAYETKIEGTNLYTLALDNAPSGMALKQQQNTVTWTPTSSGGQQVLLSASNGQVMVTKQLKFHVYDSRADVIMAVSKLAPTQTLTKAAQTALDSAKTTVDKLAKTGTIQAFYQGIQAYQQAIQQAEELAPKLSDGSLDYAAYPDMATATVTGFKNSIDLGTLVDNNPNTFDGNFTKPEVIDFGANYQVNATAFEFLARTGFPNRLQGANVYGSNDGQSWTLLTEKMTSQTNDWEKIAVKADQLDKNYRYLKIQVDQPGPDTDPAYPGIITRGEFHIFGTRIENN